MNTPMRKICLSLLPFFLPLSAAAQQPDWDAVEFKTTDLGDGIYMLQGMGGNLGLSVGDDGVFLIDDDFAPLAPKAIAAIAAITDQPVEYVINTHWHGDHTGGNQWLGEDGAVIVAHANVHGRLLNADASGAALPDITFTEEIRLQPGTETIRIIPVARAHTDGDAFVYFEEANVLHTGDLFFNGLYPYIDASSMGSLAGTIAAQRAMLELINPETKIIPGHGSMASRGDLVATVANLQDIHAALEPLVNAELPIEDIVSRRPLAGLNLGWGTAVMDEARFVRVAVSAMKKEQEEP